MFKVGILGGGTWGVALARMLSHSGYDVMVWMRNPQQMAEYTHPHLPGVSIPREICFTDQMEGTCCVKDLLIFAVPSVAVRQVAQMAAPYIQDGQIIANVAKGIERGTHLTMCGILQEELEQPHRHVRLVALSGPTHAEEVARDLPTTIVAASEDREAAHFVQDVCMNTCMRVYTNSDILGVELSGAMKNVIALSCGIAAGLGVGDNGRAAIITRGMAEISRLGVAMGCREETFYGLAGIGDLIVTSTSVHSRNYRAGYYIGQGDSPEAAVKKVGMVVEGINALPAVLELSTQWNVELPITEMVDAIIKRGIDPKQALDTLMNRQKRPE